MVPLNASLSVTQDGIFFYVYCFPTLFNFLSELFWTAPEFLGEDVSVRCSQPGDVYSYGIILSELLNREEPYSSLCMEPRGKFLNHCEIYSKLLIQMHHCAFQ